MNNAAQAADLLAQTWAEQKQLEELPASCRPADVKQAYACQAQLVEQLTTHYGEPVGYKIGCTNEWAQQLLSIDTPFYGRLLQRRVYQSPARLDASDYFMRIIEPEFAFKMARDLPADEAPYDESDIIAAIDTILPAIEVVDSRYQDWMAVDAASLIADNGSHGAWVQGADYEDDWRALDLAEHTMTLQVNDQVIRHGSSQLVMGNPLNALVWLVNTLTQQGYGLQTGDLISTGVCCEIYKANAGDSLRADFGVLGVIELTFD